MGLRMKDFDIKGSLENLIGGGRVGGVTKNQCRGNCLKTGNLDSLQIKEVGGGAWQKRGGDIF